MSISEQPYASGPHTGKQRRKMARRQTAKTKKKRQPFQPDFHLLERRMLLSTFTVNNSTDTPVAGETDLRQAIASANSTTGANTIEFASGGTAETITLSSQLTLSNTSGLQTITGPTGSVTVSGGNPSRVFQVNSGVTASISGLTISGGKASYGGGIDNQGTLTLTGTTISGNSASGNGGGLYSLGGRPR